MSFSKEIFFAFLLIGSIAYCVEKVEEIEEPVLLFGVILDSAKVTDDNKKKALISIFEKIPDRSEHEKNIKRLLEAKFAKKFGVSIAAVKATPTSEPEKKEEIEQTNTVPYLYWLLGGGSTALGIIATYLMLRGQRQAGGLNPQLVAAQAYWRQVWG